MTQRKIQNFEELAISGLRRAGLEIAEAGLWAIDTSQIIRDHLEMEGDMLRIAGETVDLHKIGRVVVAGVGKCTLRAAAEVEEVLGDRIDDGAVLYIGDGPSLKKIRTMEGTHPLPSEENIRGTGEIVRMLEGLDENDLLIFIVSGGGSTLLCFPEDRQCRDESLVLKTLMNAGASIREINTVRKHLSLARGGHIAKYAYPARVVSLVFSDVPGNDLQFIASGPTVKDVTTVPDAEAVLKKYDILNACGMERCGLVETPKEDKYFEAVRNIVVASGETALTAMAARARAEGFDPRVCSACMEGEAREVGMRIAEELRGSSPGTALLYGGETTVTVRGKGRGGRNLEVAASALGLVGENEIIIPFNSDGRDNGGAFAGAVCDTITRNAVREKGCDAADALRKNDTYPLFEKAGHYIQTGDTGSNVSDLVLALKQIS